MLLSFSWMCDACEEAVFFGSAIMNNSVTSYILTFSFTTFILRTKDHITNYISSIVDFLHHTSQSDIIEFILGSGKHVCKQRTSQTFNTRKTIKF